jgi:alpha-galactosidase
MFALGCMAWGTVASAAWAQTAGSSGAGLHNGQVRIVLGCGAGCLWEYGTVKGGPVHRFAAPVFEVDGKKIAAQVGHFAVSETPARLNNGVTEYGFEGPVSGDAHLRLAVQFQVNERTSVVRFRYLLRSDETRKLTAAPGENDLTYFQTSLRDMPDAKEIALSDFVDLTHSFTLSETKIEGRHFEDGAAFMGPILAASDAGGRHSFLVAYEHGSQAPDAFVQFRLSPDRGVRLTAVKGNYYPGELVDAAHSYRTIWMETAAVDGDMDKLASTYRRYVLRYMSENAATRKPYIFYNTWNFQERNKGFNGRPYLESMNEDRILKEIDVAHRMGIDVFVLDTGWYEKTGDWTVSRARFPDGLKAVKAKLDGYGMKLGLWLSPTQAAISSKVVVDHPEWKISWNGKVGEPREVWETEKSYGMCLVSGYADVFADELIRLAKDVGVSYFKWDAVHQYGCNDPHHNHGTEANTAAERGDSYAFQLVGAMSSVAEKVAKAVPGTIVDFDVTERGRALGLGFLSSGKFFLINNGPYTDNYDLPKSNLNVNLFFYPGEARTWITRSPLTFDKWIPSVLFLTHYFPDDPKRWQEVNVASLILGQNGIWGDLPGVSPAGVDYIGGVLAKYKQVREDITEADPVVTGIVSGSPEIHEKVSTTTGRGVVVIFATQSGTYDYVTQNKVASGDWTSDGVKVERDGAGRAKISATFAQAGAKIIFFGVQN